MSDTLTNWPAKVYKHIQGNGKWFSLEGSISRSQRVVFLFGEVEGHVTRKRSDDNCVKVKDSERCQVLHLFFFPLDVVLMLTLELWLGSER